MITETKTEKATASLFGEIHNLPEPSYVKQRGRWCLSNERLGFSENFLGGKRCLDAGIGGQGYALNPIYELGCREIHGIDLSAENLETALAHNIDISEFLHLRRQNILELDFEDNFFDFIHCAGVVHSTISPSKAMSELYRCLAPDGLCYIAVYGKGGLIHMAAAVLRFVGRRLPYSLLMKLLPGLFGGNIACHLLDYIYVPVQLHYTEDEAKKLMTDAGFVSVKRLPNPTPMGKSLWEKYLRTTIWDGSSLFKRIIAGSGWVVCMGRKG